jgi:hypothetical protein
MDLALARGCPFRFLMSRLSRLVFLFQKVVLQIFCV